MDLSAIPRIPLAHLPTPLERMHRLSEELGHAGLWLKRDDCTGLALGGNKTRKLEFTMAHAVSKGADVIITSGAVQSNHVRQTAAAAAKLGLRCHAVVSPPAGAATVRCGLSGNLLLGDILGCTLHLVADDGAATSATIDALERSEKANGAVPYVIPLGASDGIGSLGYVNCARELLQQCAVQGAEPSHVVLATGSAGTQAGLLAGLRLSGSPIRVIGISVSEPAEIKRDRIKAILKQLNACQEIDAVVCDEDIVVLDSYVGAGYAQPTHGAA